MIDFERLLKYLFRFKWIIMLAAIVGGVVAFLLVQELPNTYTSTAQLSVSSIIQQQYGGGVSQQQYEYLEEVVKSKQLLNALSYRLMLHDLAHPDSSFTEWSDELKSLSAADISAISIEYSTRRDANRLLSVMDNSGAFKLYDFVHAMQYDDGTLGSNLTVINNSITGMIGIEFTSENPELSVFVVNTLGDELIRYYQSTTGSSLDNALSVLDSIVSEKHRVLLEKRSRLAGYKTGTGVASVGQQSTELYSRVNQYEQQRASALQQIASLKGTIQSIEQKLNAINSQSTPSNNSEILLLDQQLKEANQRYVDNGFLADDKKVIDSLQSRRSTIARASSQQSPINTAKVRQDLQDQKRSLETQLALVENSMTSIESELSSLRARYNATMPVDASLQRYEQEEMLANQEYLDALNRYNGEKNNSISNVRLSLVQPGTPGIPEAPKKMIYIAGAGFASGSIALAVLSLIFFFDRRIVDASQLRERTGAAILTALPFVREKKINMESVWAVNGERSDFADFKSSLRSLRFDIGEVFEKASGDSDVGNVLLITSLKQGDGKTLLSTGLAYAFAATGKNMLLITGSEPDVLTPALTEDVGFSTMEFDAFLVKREIKIEDRITILRSNSDHTSLMELGNRKNIQQAFEVLKEQFDLIIIDSVDLEHWSQVQEWLAFSDGIVALFKSGSKVNEEDSSASVLTKIKQHPRFLGWVFNGRK